MRKQSLDGIMNHSLLFSTYIREFSQVGQLYDHNPGDITSYRERQEWLRREYRQNRETLVGELTGYNRLLGCGEATEENLVRLSKEGTLAVVTGQQAGVATGPLYTVYKAITTIQLAGKLEAELGVPVVPVFWVASEDHDYQEVNHIYALKGIGSQVKLEEVWGKRQPLPERLALAGYPIGRPPVGEIPVDDQVFGFIAGLGAYLPETAHKRELVQLLGETAQASSNLAEWFGRLMTALLGRYGLIMADPMLPGLRRLLVPFFQQAVRGRAGIREVLEKTGKSLQEMGFEAAFEAEEGLTGLFTVQGGQRLPVTCLGGKYVPRGLTLAWDKQELLELAEKAPDRFSCSAFLRPVAQDVLFPTVAYVGGPGEIAYFGQLKGVYRIFGQQMPVVFPRQGYTLVEPETEQILGRHKLGIADVHSGLEKLLAGILQDVEGKDVRGIFSQARESITREHVRLMEQLGGIAGELRELGSGNLGRILYQLDYLEKKTHQQLRKKHRVLVNELHFAVQALFPKGRIQERTFNIVPYLAGYGRSWLDRLVAEDIELGFRHWAVFLEKE